VTNSPAGRKFLLDNPAFRGFSYLKQSHTPVRIRCWCFPFLPLPVLSVGYPAPQFCLDRKGVNVPEETGLSNNAACGLAYLTFIPAIIFLVVAPYNQNPTVRFHSWQSIFLAIAWFAVWVVLVIIGVIPFINFLDVILFPVLGIGFLILWIIVMVNAFQGKSFKIPVLGQLAEKQAGGHGI
jgi:uncharacterized membrane protein